MKAFFGERFQRYSEERNEPELDASSGLSPYLHFGHISVHEVFAEVVRREKWNPAKVALRANGRREGWWNMSGNAEGFLDDINRILSHGAIRGPLSAQDADQSAMRIQLNLVISREFLCISRTAGAQ